MRMTRECALTEAGSLRLSAMDPKVDRQVGQNVLQRSAVRRTDQSSGEPDLCIRPAY